jgi:amphi-Trp domain-containing protein
MKYQQDFLGSRREFAEFLKKTMSDMFTGVLKVEGQTVSIPSDRELDYKIKYNVDEDSGSLAIKVTWDNALEEDEDM